MQAFRAAGAKRWLRQTPSCVIKNSGPWFRFEVRLCQFRRRANTLLRAGIVTAETQAGRETFSHGGILGETIYFAFSIFIIAVSGCGEACDPLLTDGLCA